MNNDKNGINDLEIEAIKACGAACDPLTRAQAFRVIAFIQRWIDETNDKGRSPYDIKELTDDHQTPKA